MRMHDLVVKQLNFVVCRVTWSFATRSIRLWMNHSEYFLLVLHVGRRTRPPTFSDNGVIICHVPPHFSLQVSSYIGFTPNCPPHVLQQNCAHGFAVMQCPLSGAKSDVFVGVFCLFVCFKEEPVCISKREPVCISTERWLRTGTWRVFCHIPITEGSVVVLRHFRCVAL